MARMSVVTAIRNALTAAIVGSTCRLRLFQIRTGSVWARTPARNSEISNSSNEARNPKRAADNTPGNTIGSTTRQKTRARLAPRPSAARSRSGSTACSADSRIKSTMGIAITAWQSPSHRKLPISPSLPAK